MMRKLMLWGTAVAIAVVSTAGVANVVVVKSLGPSAKAYPPGKTLPESAKISLQGGDVVTVLGPASAQTLRGPGSFDAKQVAPASAAAQVLIEHGCQKQLDLLVESASKTGK